MTIKVASDKKPPAAIPSMARANCKARTGDASARMIGNASMTAIRTGRTALRSVLPATVLMNMLVVTEDRTDGIGLVLLHAGRVNRSGHWRPQAGGQEFRGDKHGNAEAPREEAGPSGLIFLRGFVGAGDWQGGTPGSRPRLSVLKAANYARFLHMLTSCQSR